MNSKPVKFIFQMILAAAIAFIIVGVIKNLS